MDYTLSNGYVLDAATGKRMHVENQAVPTAVSDRDLNSVAWSLMAIVEAAGMTGIQFSKDDPASYRRLLEALNAIYAKLDSPAFKGSPTVPTLPVGDNSLGIVNTAHLAERLAAAVQSLPMIGNSQSWVDVTGSRSCGVTYTNTSGKPIMVFVHIEGGSILVVPYVNGVKLGESKSTYNSGSPDVFVTFIVPGGATYLVTRSDSGNTATTWTELR